MLYGRGRDVPSPFHDTDRRPITSGRLRGGNTDPINPSLWRGKDLISKNRERREREAVSPHRRFIVFRVAVATAETSRRYWTAEGVADGLGTSLRPSLRGWRFCRASEMTIQPRRSQAPRAFGALG